MNSLLKNNRIENSNNINKNGEVEMVNLRSSCLDMTFFDRLESSGVVSGGGMIRQCLPEQVEGMEVAD